MRANPYLNFDGDCEAAFRFYQQTLGGEIVRMQSHGDSPIAGQVPASWRDRILHARLEVEDVVLMGSDAPPDRYQRPAGLHVSLAVEDTARAERIFTTLAEGGTVQMPFEQTFWAERFGMCVDRFGIPWMVNAGSAP